jgi:hypothetical protein
MLQVMGFGDRKVDKKITFYNEIINTFYNEIINSIIYYIIKII